MRHRSSASLLALLLFFHPACADEILTGPAAFGDWRADAPGVQRKISPADLPPPFSTHAANNPHREMRRPAGAVPKVPPGFEARLFAQGFDGPRVLRIAPNGDVYVAESWGARILVFPASRLTGSGPYQPDVFAKGLLSVYGLAFGPSRENPQYLYAAISTGIIRYPFRPGASTPDSKGEWIVRNIPGRGHHTRDLAFSPDGKTLYVAVGSLSNVAQETGGRPADLAAWEKARLPGAAWGREDGRASVIAYDPDGGSRRIYATGLRNCAGMAIDPANGLPWCVVNERDGLGDNLPTEYATSVKEGGFYGWPWYYIGDNEDPRHKGERPDLKGKAIVPDVLFQAHSAPLGIAFYQGGMFPAEYRGDAFVTLHGSWNRTRRTGYKLVRLRFEGGKPTGVYQDFMTGFVIDDASAWGRPVGVAVMKDGSLLVSEDANGTIWRVTYNGK